MSTLGVCFCVCKDGVMGGCKGVHCVCVGVESGGGIGRMLYAWVCRGGSWEDVGVSTVYTWVC